MGPATNMLWMLLQCANLDVGAGQTYSTIQDAVDAANANDVILVHPGTYSEDLDLGKNGPIRIEAVMAGMAVLQGVIDIDGSDWELADLTIEIPEGSDGIKINGDRILIEGIDLSGGTRDGIDGGGTDVTVRGSVIHLFDGGASDAHCIVLNPGAENWVIEDNELFDCSGDGVQLYSDGFERTILETTIQRNLIYYTGAIDRTENAIDVKNADGLYIRSNVMWGFPDNKTLVFQKGPINVEVTCNEMSDGFTGVEFRGEDGGTVENIVFAYNLMVDYPEYALKFDGTIGAEVYNNTFVNIDNDGLRLEEESLQNGLIQNNLWVNTVSIEGDGDFTADHNGFWMVNDVQIGSPTDVTEDPILDGDYRLVAGSPLIDAGVDVGWNFQGDNPDIGWDELGGMPCDEPPDGGDDGSSSDDGDGTAGDSADATADGDSNGGDGPDGDGDSNSNGDGPDGDGDGGSGDGGSGGSGADGGGTDGGDDGGCGCRANPQTPVGLALMLGFAAFARRRYT